MREDLGLCKEFRIHKHKLVFFLSAMRHFAQSLQNQKRTVHYQTLNPTDHTPFPEALTRHCQAHQINTVHCLAIADQPFRQSLKNTLTQNNIQLNEHASPVFLTPRDGWLKFKSNRNRLMMADFYIWQRKRLNILLDKDQKPLGSKWSFDPDNRKRLPKNHEPPYVPRFVPDIITQEVQNLVEQTFPDHPGSTANFDWPVTRAEALHELDEFLQARLTNFGPYEDAVSKNHEFVYHSLVSPLINAGLLTPQEVIEKALEHQDDAPLNSVEGFVRQIIGWREFIYQIHLDYQESHAHKSNPRQADRRLTQAWYDGTTGLSPLDETIKKLENRAWVHHIPRLMILGSAMLMSDVHPDEVFRWFMEMFIDSGVWVMEPNIYGMSQWADGGVFATKPYISGSNYILKMTDYKSGDWCEVWDGLYWRFLAKHRETLAQNPRMTVILRNLDTMPADKKDRLFKKAERFIEMTTAPPN